MNQEQYKSIDGHQQSQDKGANQGSMRPQEYLKWYQELSKQLTPYYYTPEQYFQWYQYQSYYQWQTNQYPQTYQYYPTYSTNQALTANKTNVINQKKQKLSRNQKRKLKKKEMQEEYQKQKKSIGKWVDLQRKDLVEGLKKIQQQEQKIKQKRKQRLSHLIQIHKQVYKHMVKKNKGKVIQNRQKIGNFRRKKKKPSHIKKMKELYQKIKRGQKVSVNIQQSQSKAIQKDQKMCNAGKQQQNEQDYITESESQGQEQDKALKIQENKQKIGPQVVVKNQQKAKVIKTIEYETVGKLNGHVYNGITLRQWVDHVPSAKLEDIVLRFINRLAYKQAIKKVNQPEKARKLIVAGLHECRRTLWTKLDNKRSKLLIIALNIERNNLQRGTDDQLQQILNYAKEARVPVVHISTRSKIGRAFTGKFGPRITIVSVVNYEGYQDMMQFIIDYWTNCRKIYEQTHPLCFKLNN